MMIFITIKCWRKNANVNFIKSESLEIGINNFDKAWVISFITFFLIHIFDITYFDGRISTLAWILLSGMRTIIRDN